MKNCCYIRFQGGNVHLNMAINVLAEIPSYLACMFILDKSGRRPILIGTQLGNEIIAKYILVYHLMQILISASGLACLTTLLVPSTWGHWPLVVLSTLGKFATSAAFALIYLQVCCSQSGYGMVKYLESESLSGW